MRVQNERPWSRADAEKSRAAFYGMYLRLVEGLDADEAAILVMNRYPSTRPVLERFKRPAALDPTQGYVGWNEEP